MSRAAHEFDLVVIGGGLVGASLACALCDSGLTIAVVEAVPFADGAQPSYDERTVTLSYGSTRILAGIGAFAPLAHEAAPIREIHVNDAGRPPRARLSAAEAGVPALGYVTATRALGRALQPGLAHPSIRLFCPARLRGFDADAHGARVEVEHEGALHVLRARLVVGADGARSALRTLAGVRAREFNYGQTALVTLVTPERPHQDIAHERFTRTGPLAFLPYTRGRCAVVWTLRPADADAMRARDAAQCLAALRTAFGERLGELRALGARLAYPLVLTRAQAVTAERVALIGNAAQTLHPVAGQGFNLGLRDVAALAQTLVDARRAGRDIGDARVLSEYAAWRAPDRTAVVRFTHGLARVFSNEFAPLAVARNLGLAGVELLPPLKRALTRRTLGFNGRVPRLALGLPL